MTKRGRAGVALAALAGFAGLLLAMGARPVTSVQEAQAQTPNGCVGYRICIEKQTTTRSNVEFPFLIDIETVKDTSSQVDGATIYGPTTYYLSDGEAVGIEFYGEATITELTVPGWQLVDIECEGTSDFGVEIHGNTLEIYYLIGTRESFLHCVFVNQEIRQPLNLGGLFAGQPTPLPTAPPPPAAVAPAPAQGISPPRTGDGGLK